MVWLILGLQGLPLDPGENRSIPQDMKILPERLKKLGYANHLVGKWHLGGSSRNHTPTARGFDSHFGYWHGFVGYFSYLISTKVPNETRVCNS